MALNKQKLVIISNRLPVTVSKNGGKLEFTHSSGGLATAMTSLDSGLERVWIGWPGIAADELSEKDKTAIIKKLRSYGCVPVFLTHKQISFFYEKYSNETIWPLFHYFQTLIEYSPKAWKVYKQVNEVFCKVTLEHSQNQSLIWVHDYHLLLLPKLLRDSLPSAQIGFFLHIPFPSSEIFRLLPDKREVLEGMLGADLIGFHIYDNARHFQSSVLRTLGLDSQNGLVLTGNRSVRIDSFPIGIDYKKLTSIAKSPSVNSRIDELKQRYSGMKLIISVDRLDYTKGIPERLEAYSYLLETNPSFHKKIALIVLAVPSRTDVAAYQDLRDRVEMLISQINGRFGSSDWTPITYQFQNLPPEEVVCLYGASDVALVTPIRDGMNLVAKEYVVSRLDNGGVLILSELTGSAQELPEALAVNPNDSMGIALAIKSALSMPKTEQKKRMALMQSRLKSYSIQRWGQDFIEQLVLTKESSFNSNRSKLDISKTDKMVRHYKIAAQRALFLDYDGTLAPFVNSPDPSLAKPSKGLISILKSLTEDYSTNIFIVSGRTKEALEKWFKGIRVNLFAEHGLWTKQNGEWFQSESSLHNYRGRVMNILEHYAERTAGARIEQKSHSIVWHYRNVSPELAFIRNSSLVHELGLILENTEIGMFNGHKVIEVKPKSVHKGVIVTELLAGDPYDFILAIGDDQTDEDMFEALPPHAYSIKVGPGETKAANRLPSVGEVHNLLRILSSN